MATVVPDQFMSYGRLLEQFISHAALLVPLSDAIALVLAFHGLIGLAKSYLEKQT